MAEQQAEDPFGNQSDPDMDEVASTQSDSDERSGIFDMNSTSHDDSNEMKADSSEGSEATSKDGSSVYSRANRITDETERWWMENAEKKRLFICCDGTWQNASGTISPLSNVAKLARAVTRLGQDDYGHANPEEVEIVRKRAEDEQDVNEFDPRNKKQRVGLVRQLVYYSSGIGAQTALNVERGYSGLTGKGLESTILNAYCFICNNYNFPSNKDEIILVGFSRGAFAVRCLANFIDKVGLLRRKGLTFLRPLFDSWKRWGRADENKKAELETELDHRLQALEGLRRHVPIRILAEWDTVSAMGLPLGLWRERFSFVNDKVPGRVEHAFLALALDEKRRSFKPRPWKEKANPKTVVEQCAFVGCHSDIGGGNADSGLSTISLIWMIGRIREHSRADFDERVLLQFVFPHQPKRTMSLGTPKMELRNCAGTTGLLHESFRGWWRIPWALSFGLWHGKRDKIIHNGSEFLKLEAHFTVNLLLHRDASKDSAQKKINSEVGLQEARTSRHEYRRFRTWIRIANHFHSQGQSDQHVEDEDSDVDWTDLAEGLGWHKPDGKMKENAIVTLITPKIEELELKDEDDEECSQCGS